jgi:hypothetical protein
VANGAGRRGVVGGLAVPGEGWLGFRQRPAHGWLRRVRVALLNRLSNRPPRSQRVYLAEIRGHRYKRVVFADSAIAHRAARNLSAFAGLGIYPEVLLERERELWTEFFPGTLLSRLEPLEPSMLEQLADLLAVLYTRAPRRVPVERTPFAHALHADLRFLRQVGVLEEDVERRLQARAERETPAEVWVGYDCTDFILKNFVLGPEGRVRGIDAESLNDEQLIGSGFAKGAVRWLGPRKQSFLDLLGVRGVPDFRSYLPFVEMSFVAFWLKSSFLEKKKRFVDPGLLDPFLDA